MTNSLMRALLPLLGLALGTPALAEDRCKLAITTHLPVVMDGNTITMNGAINGHPIPIAISSGSFFNIMSPAEAKELGLGITASPGGLIVSGIGGSAEVGLATVHDLTLGTTHIPNVVFMVGGNDNRRPAVGVNLFGTSDIEFDLANGTLNLIDAAGCNHTMLAYWAKDMAVGEARLFSDVSSGEGHIFPEVLINGQRLRAILTTSGVSSMGLRAAQRIGIDMTSPDVTPIAAATSFGKAARSRWLVRSVEVSIGGEKIANTPFYIYDDTRDSVSWDMVLGGDFLMSHHVLVSRGQDQMYLTYNGGPIFAAGRSNEFGPLRTVAKDMGAPPAPIQPKTANEFFARGTARLAAGNNTGATDDFTAALALTPGRGDILSQRAHAFVRQKMLDKALADFDAALAVAPKDPALLQQRGAVRLLHGDRPGALADAEAAAGLAVKGSLDALYVAALFERLGQADQALALIDPVIALHRDDGQYPDLLNARAWNRALANADLDRALADINTALHKRADQAQYLDTRALVQLRRKDYAAAIADTDTALASNPKLSSSLYVRGLAHAVLGQSDKAKADFAAARAISPNIDQRYAAYGLIAPDAPPSTPAQSTAPGGDDDDL